jgi:rhamnosyltransferase subunit B
MLSFIAIAEELTARGRRVAMLVPRFQEACMRTTKVPYESFGTHAQGQALLDNPDVWDARKGGAVGPGWRRTSVPCVTGCSAFPRMRRVWS